MLLPAPFWSTKIRAMATPVQQAFTQMRTELAKLADLLKWIISFCPPPLACLFAYSGCFTNFGMRGNVVAGIRRLAVGSLKGPAISETSGHPPHGGV